jgi:hypothetical protein
VSGLLRRAEWRLDTNVSEDRAASIFRVVYEGSTVLRRENLDSGIKIEGFCDISGRNHTHFEFDSFREHGANTSKQPEESHLKESPRGESNVGRPKKKTNSRNDILIRIHFQWAVACCFGFDAGHPEAGTVSSTDRDRFLPHPFQFIKHNYFFIRRYQPMQMIKRRQINQHTKQVASLIDYATAVNLSSFLRVSKVIQMIIYMPAVQPTFENEYSEDLSL